MWKWMQRLQTLNIIRNPQTVGGKHEQTILQSPCCCCCRFSRVRLCATPQTAARQAPPSLGFSRQEHWSGLPFPSPVHEREKWKWRRSVLSDPQRPHGLQPTRLLLPWDFPGKSTGVGCHLEGTNLTDILISYFWPPELEDNTFLLGDPPILCSYTLGENMCKPHI